MAPPLPPSPAFWPWPTALFSESTLLRMFHDTPMLLSAPPLAHALPRPGLPPNVLFTTQTGRFGPAPAATQVRAQVVAHVVEEATIDDLEAAALRVNGAAARGVRVTFGNAFGAAV